MRTFVQIGTNNGNDRFRALVQTEKPDVTVLIEPNTIHNESIRRSYTDVPNVILINHCIYEKDDEEVTLFIPAINGVYGNSGENGYRYDDGHYSLVPMNDWGEKSNMHTIKAPSIRFDTLCKRLNISTIDYLQIDTEGYDSEIIRMIDLDAITIRKIRYEQWNFDETEFTRYNSQHDSLGKKGMKYVNDKLTAHGYTLFPINEPNNVDILAVKQ
jgi:FkbM family methyltransferase